MILNQKGIKTKYLDPHEAGLTVTGEPNDAIVSPETYLNLDKIKIDSDEHIIFPGFFGITPSGHIATFSRGGSDITGAILAKGLHAYMKTLLTSMESSHLIQLSFIIPNL